MSRKIVARAPRFMGLDSDRRGATLSFLNKCREAADNTGSHLTFDLDACEEIPRSVCLLLTAELERCLRSERDVIGFHPNSLEAVQTLDAFGLYKHLKITSPLSPGERRRARRNTILVRSVDASEEDACRQVEDVAKLANRLFRNPALANNIMIALTEALTNINRHAYGAELNGSLDRWWFSGSLDKKRREVLFYALDHGAGIPARAPETMARALLAYWQKRPKRRKAAPDSTPPRDHEVLKAAIRAPRDGVGLEGHGKGLPTMVGLIEEEADAGSIQILSGRAIYRYDKKPSWEGKPIVHERCYPLSKSFPGTLVIWRIAAPIRS